MAHVVNDGLVAFVRRAEGGTVKLYAGDTVPAEAEVDHVAALAECGVLSEVKEQKGGRSQSSSSNDPS